MNKIMMAAVAATGIFAAGAAESGQGPANG